MNQIQINLNIIKRQVEHAWETGLPYFEYRFAIHPEVRRRLQKEGYFSFGDNETYTKVYHWAVSGESEEERAEWLREDVQGDDVLRYLVSGIYKIISNMNEDQYTITADGIACDSDLLDSMYQVWEEQVKSMMMIYGLFHIFADNKSWLYV